ncbi:DUF6879 family protein [Saccharopolyspora flava]|uniref:DUF6879 domain-containing protein n=1 Tax=Saccharopolyspora flava TaxID=95161 RepID=A0A1I6UI48_9PSEU|nr:DUF6879 family protein [Saccharopolyspora flava]SFT01146.1 hypothetical protein SAMN05660874_04922 [Saccharopolyspora flava]
MILSNLRERFAECRRSAWRFEAQPTYTMPGEQEELELWRAGEPMPDDFNSAWHGRVAGYVERGVSVGRVRVVRRPFTEYLRHQFDWVIPGNTRAGEDVRILDVTDVELELPDQDFWIFDDEIVVDLNFNPDGTLINLEQQENPDLSTYRKWRDTALAHAVPFSDFHAGT